MKFSKLCVFRDFFYFIKKINYGGKFMFWRKKSKSSTLYSLTNGYRKLELKRKVKERNKAVFSIVYFEDGEPLCFEVYKSLYKAKKAFNEFIYENNYLEN